MDQQSFQAGEDILELATDPIIRKARQERRRYEKAASLCTFLHSFLQWSIVLLSISTVVLFLLTHIQKDVPFILTVLVLLAIGAEGLIKPKQRSAIYHDTAETIARELTDCIYKQGLYKGADTRILLNEQLVWLERNTSEQLARMTICAESLPI
jgi:hypothetical protein